MKAQTIVLILFATLFLSLASVSAALTFSPTSISTTGLHNSQIAISFNLTTDTNYSSLVWSNGTTTAGMWALPTTTTSINTGEVKQLTAVFSIPPYQSGTITSSIVVQNGTTSASLPVTIAINSSSSFTLTNVNSISRTQNGTIKLTNTGNTAITLNLASTGTLNLTFNETLPITISAGTSKNILASTTNNWNSVGIKSVGITASSSGLENQTISYSVMGSYCKSGPVGGNLSIVDISDESDLSEDRDAWDWRPLDTIKLKVEISNVDDDAGGKDRDVTVKVGLFKVGSTSSEDLGDEAEQSVSIDKDTSDKDVDFEFKLPADLDEGDYYLYAKVYDGESTHCGDSIAESASSIQTISVDKNSYEIVVDEVTGLENSVLCGTDIILNAKAYNLGTEDAKDTYITMNIPDLKFVMSSDKFKFNSDSDPKTIPFAFKIPANATDKTYTVYFYTYYGTDKEGTKKDPFTTLMTLEGCKAATSVSITADFSSETPKAVIGSQTIIEAVIKNTGTSTATYTIEVSGASEWATATVDPKSVTLNAGESKKVSVYLDINKNAAVSEKEFTIKATSGSTVIEYQVKGIQLEKGLSSSAIIQHIKDNWFIYAIVLINVILIIAIIVAIKSLVRKAD